MATITQTVEETLTFTAKPPQKLKKLQFQEPAIPASDSYEELKLGPQILQLQPTRDFKEQKLGKLGFQTCPPGCEDCKRMISQIQQCPPGCQECEKQKSQPKTCPPNCVTCKQQKFKTIPVLFNAIGIIVAILATYMIISTDSHIYLVFWVGYSVLRRMMTKSKPHVKTE